MNQYSGGEMAISLWRNNKNREIYVVEYDDVECATNGSEGNRMVVYYKTADKKYVRTYDEFLEKFTRLSKVQFCPLKKGERGIENAS